MVRNPRGSHSTYEGFVKGKRRLVTIAAHRLGDDVHKGTLGSIIRQSGLPKKKFR